MYAKRRNQGFLLVDALFALLVISFCLLVLLQAFIIWQASFTQFQEVDGYELYQKGTRLYDD